MTDALAPLDGIVSAVFARRCLVWADEREWECIVAGRLLADGGLAVGDRVRIMPKPSGQARVEAVQARQGTLSRVRRGRDTRSGRPAQVQVLAANLDQLLIVAAIAEPPFRMRLVERFLVAAGMAGLRPLIAVTKLDLDREGRFAALREELAALGATTFGISLPAKQAGGAGPAGLEPLREALRGRLSALIGHSGVGKSTLVNALAGANLAVGAVDEQDRRGRHTTSTARLIPLPGGGGLIDSPGIREFALHDVTPAALAHHFPGWSAYEGRCRFTDCRHHSETGCAVREALAAGELDAARYAGYLKLLEEVEQEQTR